MKTSELNLSFIVSLKLIFYSWNHQPSKPNSQHDKSELATSTTGVTWIARLSTLCFNVRTLTPTTLHGAATMPAGDAADTS